MRVFIIVLSIVALVCAALQIFVIKFQNVQMNKCVDMYYEERYRFAIEISNGTATLADWSSAFEQYEKCMEPLRW